MGKRTVYLVFLDTGTLLARAIDSYTGTSLNHVSISLDKPLNYVYSFGRKRPYNPLIGGFVKENLQLPFFNKTKCAIYQLEISENQYDRLQQRIILMESHKHLYRYNFLGLFGVMLNKDFQRENAYFCSQFVATMLQDCGIYQDMKPPSLIRPQDLRSWTELKLIYNGKIQEYPYFESEQEQSAHNEMTTSSIKLG